MDRELLIEIGCEEIPASWLPGLTRQVGEQLDARLKEFRLNTEAKTETYSTPRRLTARVAKLAERQEDFEELDHFGTADDFSGPLPSAQCSVL